MNIDDVRASILRLGPWHHDVEVLPGIRTAAVTASQTYAPELGVPSVICPDEILEHVLRDVYPDGLAGRSVLDCACNAGGYLFAAGRLGAGRRFGFDVRDHWIRQARFLAEYQPGSEDLEFATCDLAALPALHRGTFDVTLFLGLFYHLPDPVAGLRIAAEHTSELLIVNTSTSPSNEDALILSPESETEVMSGVHRLAWLPSGPRVVEEILTWCGFEHTRLQYEGEMPGGLRRIQILAARDRATFARYDESHPMTGPRRARSWLRRLFRSS